MPRRHRGRGNVAARINHLSKRRTARDSRLWWTYLDVAAKFLGAPRSEERISILSAKSEILASKTRRLERVPPSVLDRWLPWLYENVERGFHELQRRRRPPGGAAADVVVWGGVGVGAALGVVVERVGLPAVYWTPDYQRLDSEAWRELRHWIVAARPNLTGHKLWDAAEEAIDWADHLAAVGGGGPLAENLHERLPEVVVSLRENGAAWRTGGAIEVWMAIGRELGHCYKSRGVYEGYIDGYGVMYVLVGKDGKPRVTVSIKDCQVEVKGSRNQLPMPRFHEAVTQLFTSPAHTWDLLAGCDPSEESPDLRAMDIAVPTEAMDALPRLSDMGMVLAATYRWEEASRKLADVKGAFPPAFWKYLAALKEVAANLRDVEHQGGPLEAPRVGVRGFLAAADGPRVYSEVSQDPETHRWFFRICRLDLDARDAGIAEGLGRALGEQWHTYPLDTRSYAGFAKSVAKIPLVEAPRLGSQS